MHHLKKLEIMTESARLRRKKEHKKIIVWSSFFLVLGIAAIIIVIMHFNSNDEKCHIKCKSRGFDSGVTEAVYKNSITCRCVQVNTFSK